MKKFTSLFALLAGLCVCSAQADVTVYVYSSDPSSHQIYWYDGENNNPGWSNGTIASNMTECHEGTYTYYKKSFSGYVGELKIILHQGETQTGSIPVSETNNCFYYYGGSNYATSKSLRIAGSFYNNWEPIPFTPKSGSMFTWTYELTPNDNNPIEFKLIAPDKDNSFFDKWIGFYECNLSISNPYVTVDVPYDWLSNKNGNFQLNHPQTGYSKYKLTASWNPTISTNFAWGWTLKIEGVGSLDLKLNDDIPFLGDGEATSATSATYARTCANQWGTLCLPFEFNADQSGVTFYEMTDVTTGENGAITFTPIYGDIEAGQPVAFKLEDDPRDFEGASCYLNVESSDENGVAVVTIAGTSDAVQGWSMHGTFTNTTLNNVYVIQANEIHPTGSGLSIKPYRAWFSGSVSGAPLRIEVADTEGLQFVEQEDGTVKAYYDLQGRKLDSARKGLVIENGKIIMVK
jgi:hypothetical protein